jgi:single-strand DNA-binding protein
MIKCEINGVLIEKSRPVVVSDKLTKSEIVVESNQGKYPQHIKIEVVNEDIKKLDVIKTLEDVKVVAYLQGRKYTDKVSGQLKYFNSVKLLSIEPLSKGMQIIEEEESIF